MANNHEDPYSVHFAHFASKLEQHLRKNGIPCHDADMIIEESSVLYFERLHSAEKNKFLSKLIKRHDDDPAQLFVECACKAIAMHFPAAKDTFGSANQIANCIRSQI